MYNKMHRLTNLTLLARPQCIKITKKKKIPGFKIIEMICFHINQW